MNDNTRDVTMSIEKTQQFVQRFIMAPALYSTIVIVQFIARMYKANQLKKTDWENFDKFSKVCDYKFEVADIPLSQTDIEDIKSKVDTRMSLIDNLKGNEMTEEQRLAKAKEMVKAGIKDKLDSMGIQYCMLDEDFDMNHIKVYYAQRDRQRFENFLGGYIKEHLVSGEMQQEELKKMMSDKVSIISVPDALEEKMQDAMKAVDTTYAKIEDLNLADGKKQMYVPNHQLQTVSQLYGEIRNGLISQGLEDPGPMQEMTQEELNATAICKNEPDFISRCDKEHQEVSNSFINEDSKSWDEISNRYEPLGTKKSVDFMQNANYTEISIDEETLVKGPSADRFTVGHAGEAFFCCRIPGTYGNNIKYLSIPKDQVFLDSHSKRTRYVAFLKNDKQNIILDKDGKPDMSNNMRTTETLRQIFDPQNSGVKLSQPLPNLSMKM